MDDARTGLGLRGGSSALKIEETLDLKADETLEWGCIND